MADLVTPSGTPAHPLPADVLALLGAVREALDLPMSHWADADQRAHHQLLIERSVVARIALSGILDKGYGIPMSTAWLTTRTADMPVTYTVWVPEGSKGGAR